MTASRGLGTALAAATGLWFVAWLATPLPAFWRTASIDLGWSVVCLLAGAAALYAASRPELRPVRISMLFLAAGALAWGAGQGVWTWYELVEGDVPYPSFADVGYVTSLALLALAVLCWPRAEHVWRRGEVVDGLLMVGAVILASYVFVLEPVIGNGVEGAGGLLLIAYPVADALLLGAILVGVTLHTFLLPGRLLVLALGLVAMVLADTFFALAGESYGTGLAAWDAGWTIAFALVGAAALLPHSWSERFRLPTSAGPLGVIALLTAAGAKQEVQELQHLPTRQAVAPMLMLMIFVGLALRYVVVARGRLQKAERLEDLRDRLEHEYRILEATIEASRTGMCLYDAEGRAIVRNAAWGRLLGAEADLSGRWAAIAADQDVRFTTPEGRSVVLAARALASGETLIRVDDVTDEEREREARNRFLAEVVGAQDLEARRIAEVLHDDVVQRLTALGMRVELAALRTGQDSLLELAREAGAVTASIRRLLIELHPAVLESQGLGPAIEAAAGSLRSIGVTVEVDELDVRLSPELEALAYRLVQEAFANVMKHARAQRVTVSLQAEPGLLRCEVADDGTGFEPNDAATAVNRGSLGLHLVRERIELVGGRFRVESGPESGTRFTFELPLPPVAAEREPAEAMA
jgi:two-component system, NarL family, sensor histidine kinase UhpB